LNRSSFDNAAPRSSTLQVKAFYHLLLFSALAATTATGLELGVRQVQVHPDEGFSLEVASTADTYLALMRGNAPQLLDTPVTAKLPTGEGLFVRLSDPLISARSFYSVHQFSTANPADLDEDGIDDFFELQHPLLLNAVDPTDAAQDADGDGDTNLAEYLAGSNPAEVSQSTVSFTTSDRISIQGTYRIPAARSGTVLPAVILIHQGFSSRAEWAPYADAFNDAGYATLAYDIRGHGGSTGSFTSADFDNPNTIPRDLQAAITFLAGKSEIDPARIGIVGASVGGNLACVASQHRWVKTAVNLSGKTSAVSNLADLAAESDLALESMFHIASSGDQGGDRAIWANALHGYTAEPRLVEVVPSSSAHGVSIFTSDPSLLGRVVDWIREKL
jgi:dienelactone hydrolase